MYFCEGEFDSLKKWWSASSPRIFRDRLPPTIMWVLVVKITTSRRHDDDGTKRWGLTSSDCWTTAPGMIERLMRQRGLTGIAPGGNQSERPNPIRITRRPRTSVRKTFQAERPNQWRVADFDCVDTGYGRVFVPFIIDAYAKSIVGWRPTKRMTAGLTLDVLKPAIGDPRGDSLLATGCKPARGSGILSLRA